MSDGSVVIDVIMDTDTAIKNAEQLQSKMKGLDDSIGDVEKASKETSSELSKFGTNTSKLDSFMSKFRASGNEMKSILGGIANSGTSLGQVVSLALNPMAMAIAGATAAAVGLFRTIDAGVSRGFAKNTELESMSTALTTIIGDTDEATRAMSELNKEAARTPYAVSDLTRAMTGLSQADYGVDDAIKYTKILGDIAQGDAEKLQRLTLAFNQATQAGRLQGDELNQMIEAGFNPLQQMSKDTGKTTAELKKLMSQGAISVDMMATAFENATKEGGKFFNASLNASTTVAGLASTIDDNLNMALADLTKPLYDINKAFMVMAASATSSIGAFTSKISEAWKASAKLKKIYQGLGMGAAFLKSIFKDGFKYVSQLFKNSVGIVKFFQTGLRSAMAPIIDFFKKTDDNGISRFTKFLALIMSSFEIISKYMTAFNKLIGAIISSFELMGDVVVATFRQMGAAAELGWKMVFGGFFKSEKEKKRMIQEFNDFSAGLWKQIEDKAKENGQEYADAWSELTAPINFAGVMQENVQELLDGEKKMADTYDQMNKKITKEAKDSTKGMGKTFGDGLDNEIKIINTRLDQIPSEINKNIQIGGAVGTKGINETITELDTLDKKVETLIIDQENKLKSLEQEIALAKSDIAKQQAEKTLKEAEKQLDTLVKINDTIDKERDDAYKGLEDMKQARQESFEAGLDAFAEFATTAGQGAFDITNMWLENEMNAVDKHNKEMMDAMNDRHEAEEKAMEDQYKNLEQMTRDGQLSEYEARKEQARLEKEETAMKKRQEEERLKIEEDAAKARDEIARKQFYADKAFKISSIAMDTSKAIMGFWASSGALGIAGPIWATAMTATVTGIAAAETGLVLAQEYVGAYEKGGIVPKSGVALVGEKGQELVWANRGNYVSTARETENLIRLQKQAQNVYNNRNINNAGNNIVINISGAVNNAKNLAREIANQVDRTLGGRLRAKHV